MLRGTVKWFNDRKGIGFITPLDGGDDVLVQASSLVVDTGTLEEGQQVEFELQDGAAERAAYAVRRI